MRKTAADSAQSLLDALADAGDQDLDALDRDSRYRLAIRLRSLLEQLEPEALNTAGSDPWYRSKEVPPPQNVGLIAAWDPFPLRPSGMYALGRQSESGFISCYALVGTREVFPDYWAYLFAAPFER